MSITKTLEDRHQKYGTFKDNSTAQEIIMNALRALRGWDDSINVHRNGAYMIVQKLVRAFCGDPNYTDNWHDIQGYAALVEQVLTPHRQVVDEHKPPNKEYDCVGCPYHINNGKFCDGKYTGNCETMVVKAQAAKLVGCEHCQHFQDVVISIHCKRTEVRNVQSGFANSIPCLEFVPKEEVPNG